jgi:hypothetical protein
MSYCQLLKEDNAPCYYSTPCKFLNLFTKILLDYNVIVPSSNFRHRCECEAWFSYALGKMPVLSYLNKILLNLNMKFTLCHIYADTKGRRTSSNLFTTSALEGDGWSAPRFYCFTLKKLRHLLCRRMGGPRNPSE